MAATSRNCLFLGKDGEFCTDWECTSLHFHIELSRGEVELVLAARGFLHITGQIKLHLLHQHKVRGGREKR